MPEFKLAVNALNKATELPLLSLRGYRGSVQENPHMRAFWWATISFFLAFTGWFALAPLELEVASSIGVCENQLYPPEGFPKRKAYLNAKNFKSGKAYCRYGKNDPTSPTDCKDAPAGVDATNSSLSKYDPKQLPHCVCTPGTRCRGVLIDSATAGVASTIFMRGILGALLERFGPTNVLTGLLLHGAIWVYAAAGISSAWSLILIRFFIGTVGATFVANQFWCSLMFAPNIVGTANATSAGWGNLGGGVTQIFMVLALVQPFMSMGLSEDSAWRAAICVPATAFVVCAFCVKFLCWDMPTAKRFSPADVGKTNAVGIRDYLLVLKDPRVVIMTFQYGACFGTEIAFDSFIVTHFRTFFQLSPDLAALLGSSVGFLNVFARALGGIVSDALFLKMGFRGRIWAQFLVLFFEACALMGFGAVTQDMGWGAALAVVLVFSLFCEMGCGTSYGIVPFMNKEQMACVSALVGAGGNLGAVIATQAFYKAILDPLLAFKVHGAYVMFWALLTPAFYWPELGGMFHGPQEAAPKATKDPASDDAASTNSERSDASRA